MAKRRYPAFRRIAIVAKAHRPGSASTVRRLVRWLRGRRGCQILIEQETAAASGAGLPGLSREEIARRADLVVVIGGDGTLLSMARLVASRRTALLGVNLGSLGFLTEVTLPEIAPSLDSVLAGTARIDQRLMLRSRVLHADALVADRLALNDVVVTRGALTRIIDLSVSVGGEFVTDVKADGLIIASPTGSTAYNLAAAGPIVHPDVDAMVLTPIAPHTLTNRPIVIPASSEVRVQPKLNDGYDEVYVTFDGQFGLPLGQDDLICVTRAEKPLRLVRASTRTYFEVLREKLKWGER